MVYLSKNYKMLLKDFKVKVKELKKDNTITNIGGVETTDYGQFLNEVLTWLQANEGGIELHNLNSDNTKVTVKIGGYNRNKFLSHLNTKLKSFTPTWDANSGTFSVLLNPASGTSVTTPTTTVDPVAAAVPNVYGKIANDLLSISPIKAITNETKLFETINRIKKLF